MIVVDANVCLKWFIPEVGMAEAFRVLRSGQKLVGPWILKDEVVSGLVRRVRREELSVTEAREGVTDWLRELQLETVHLIEDQRILTEAAEIGFEIKHPLYDCIYLALAMSLNAPLITADKPFLERARKLNHNIHALTDIDAVLAA